METRNATVKCRCTLLNLVVGNSRSPGYFSPTVLWILCSWACYSCSLLFFSFFSFFFTQSVCKDFLSPHSVPYSSCSQSK